MNQSGPEDSMSCSTIIFLEKKMGQIWDVPKPWVSITSNALMDQLRGISHLLC